MEVKWPRFIRKNLDNHTIFKENLDVKKVQRYLNKYKIIKNNKSYKAQRLC